MQSRVASSVLSGVSAVPVEVQADVGPGLPTFSIVGLGDAAVHEARERVRSAVKASGFTFPDARIVVNLAPAPLRKHGTGLDLPIALALLAATGQLPAAALIRRRAVGELSLSGEVRPVRGMLAHALCARSMNAALLCAEQAEGEIAHLPRLRYTTLGDLADLRQGLSERETVTTGPTGGRARKGAADMSEVVGQEVPKRVLEIAAAGEHNVLFVGPPGAGKTLLARRVPGILPPLSSDERIETAVVHSVAGLDPSAVLAGIRPFRSPHHTSTVGGLVGGGRPLLPGEASLAHNGVLFLDELPEFGPAALQALRQPLEDGMLTLVRSEGRMSYPARFCLVAAMNPCPCGFLGDSSGRCTCTQAQVSRYLGRIGGPLMDRIDLAVRVDRIDPDLMVRGGDEGDTSNRVRERVMAARRASEERGVGKTSSLQGARLVAACDLSSSTKEVLAQSARRQRLSGRSVTRLLRVARTIADLEGCRGVGDPHVLEAFGYRWWECR